jgi:hypothetical protein
LERLGDPNATRVQHGLNKRQKTAPNERNHNPRVGGSSPSSATKLISIHRLHPSKHECVCGSRYRSHDFVEIMVMPTADGALIGTFHRRETLE